MIKKLMLSLLILTSCSAREYLDLNCPVRPLSGNQYIKPAVYISKPCVNAGKGFNSPNWSGLIALKNVSFPQKDSVRTVWGTWDVPKLIPMAKDAYSSIWVGIDGYMNTFIEQIGTSHNWINGKQQNFAWFCVYPDPPYEIVDFPVNVGDSISASVVYTRNGVFELQIFNNTKFVYTTCPHECTQSYGPRASAQWIVEPLSVMGQFKPFANVGTVKFTECAVTIGGYYGSLIDEAFGCRKMNLTENNVLLKNLVNEITDDGKSFSLTWKHE